jgi:hypothetical protein
MKSIISLRAIGSAVAISMVPTIAVTSCNGKSGREPETSASEPQPEGEQGAGGAPGSDAGPAARLQETTPRMQGEYRSSMPATMGAGEAEAEERGSTDTGVAASASARHAGVRQLSTARCDREERCKNVGKNRKYESREQCLQKLDAKNQEDLGPEECKTGIEQEKLSTCLKAIQEEACNSPLDSLSRIVSCRSSALCAD